MRVMDYSELLEAEDKYPGELRVRDEEDRYLESEEIYTNMQILEYEAWMDRVREKNRAQRACHKAYQVGKENRRIHCRNLYANYPGCTTLSHIRRNDVRFETVGIEPEMDKSID